MATQWVDITANAKYGYYEGYIRYANQLLNFTSKTDTPQSNALAVYRIKENTHYRIQIFMQCRFRLGCTDSLTSGSTLTNYVYDPLDDNGSANVGEYRELEITSGSNQTYLAIGAWGNVCTTGLSCTETLNSIVVYEEQPIVNPLISIEVTTPPTKTDYLLGESLNTDGLVVTATYQDGATEPVSGYTLSGYDGNTSGAQAITVYYEGFTADFTVTVHGVTGLTITTPPTKTDYLTGEGLDTTGLEVTATYDNGVTSAISGYSLSGYDSSSGGVKTVTATYAGQSADFIVTVHEVTCITIIPPDKRVYNFGEPLDTTGLTVTVECSDSYSVVTEDYTISGYSPTITGEQTVTVAYRTFTAPFLVTVESNITGIEITNPPTKTSDKQGETFDATGLVVSAVMQDGSKVVVTDYVLSGFDGTVLGEQTITAYYQEQTADFQVMVVQNLLTATCGTPTLANVTATLDIYTGVLTFKGTGGIKAYSSSSLLFPSNRADIKSVVIDEGITSIGSYLFYKCSDLKSVSFPTTVTILGTYLFYQCAALTEISNLDKVTTLSSYTFYGCAALTSLSFGEGLTSIVSTTFNSCSKLTAIYIDREYDMIFGSPWGANYATVTWKTYPLARLELLTPPDKTVYRYGDSFTGTGTSVRVYYTDGAYNDITDISLLTFGGYSATKVGKQNVTVTYRTVSVYVEVTVENYITGITIVTPPTKTSYEVGEPQDNTGLTVALLYADGSKDPITEYTVSPIDYEILGAQTITVTFGEYSTGFDITGNFPTTLAKLMEVTSNMAIIRNNTRNDDSTDILTGVDWFLFNGVAASKVYISGNNWFGFGVASEQLKICRRDGTVWYERRLEGMLTNGHRFLKFEIEGYTYYSSTSTAYRLVYEVYLFDDNSMFLNVIQVPTSGSYMGTSALVCGSTTVSFTLTAGTPAMFSFYPGGEGGTEWMVEALPHKFLITGIEVTTPPEKTDYRCGEPFDTTGMVVSLVAAAGKSMELTNYDISGYDPLQAGVQTILISYDRYSTSLDVAVTDGFTVRFLYYDVNLNEDVVIDTQTVNYGQDAVPPEVNRPGYIFTGWNNDFTGITWDTDVYANFIPKNICTVLFVDYDGTVLKKQFVTRGGAASAPEIPLREGYVFAGWDMTFAFITSDITVTALYETRGDTYTVTFLGWDGGRLKSEQVIYGGSGSPPAVPERKGYFFLAWSESYEYITKDITTQAIYRSNRIQSVIEFYNGNTKAGELKMAMDCSISQRLNGECTMEITTLADYCRFVQKRFRMECDGLIFNLTNIEKKTQNGKYVITLKGEHVSYILNDEDYDISEFYFKGNPKRCLAKILQGTPFSVGTVDFVDDIMLQVNQDATRRDVLMQLVALCGGEIEYDKYKIGIRSHIGNTVPIELMETENVKNVGMSYSAAEHTETYKIELYKRVGIALGDEIHIVFTPLDINKTKRITGLDWNPFDFRTIDVSVGGYRAALSDSLYQSAEKDDATNQKIDDLETKMDNLSDTFDSLSSGLGGFNVMSVSELPENPDMNTIYLIQGAVEVD